MLVRMYRKRNIIHCWWGSKLVQPQWKSLWILLKKLKIELPLDPAILLLGKRVKVSLLQ
jgi:hypothetical protein